MKWTNRFHIFAVLTMFSAIVYDAYKFPYALYLFGIIVFICWIMMMVEKWRK